MRRSARSAKPKHFIQEAEGSDLSDEDDFVNDSDDIDNSGDEWQPEKKKRRKGKRGREEGHESGTDDDDDEDLPILDDDEEDELVMMARESSKPVKKKSKTNDASRTSVIPPSRPIKVSNVVTDEDILAAQAAIEMDEEEERQEQEAAAKEAAEMWDQVRKRKEQKSAASNQSKGAVAKAAATAAAVEATPPSLSSWLGIPEPDWPTTCADAMINDRDSLFVGFVYSLSSPSQSLISQLLSHLSKTVHPKAVPTNRLPPAMQHLATNRRGATHDMHAWRCLALKRGRSGLNGPEDFGLEEGLEDDGERFGAKPIEKVIKQLGATDVLVVVSRWYGGTMLGPVRFQHIEDCARAALSQYMINEALVPLKKQLQELDEQLSSLRSQLGTSASVVKPQYSDLDLEKIERLIGARKKAIEMMQKRLKAIPSDQPSTNGITQVTEKETIPATAPAPAVDTSQIATKIPADNGKDEDGADLTGWDALE